MKILFIACLPKRPSFGEALANRLRGTLVAAGHEIEWHDLYAEGFDPLLDPSELARGTSLDSLVQAHALALAEAGGLIVVHPDWWGQPPAILKGWIDRVFREGIAYDLAGEDGFEKEWRPLLRGKKAFVVVSSDSKDPSRSDLLRAIWVDATLGACGMEAECDVIGDLRGMDSLSSASALRAVIASIQRFFEE